MADRLTIDVKGGPAARPLTSQWGGPVGGLSKHLLATFYPVVKTKDGAWVAQQGAATVQAPLTEATMDVAMNWHSPFESDGPESKAPMLMAMIQSGTLQPLLNAVGPMLPGKAGALVDQIASSISGLSGRTAITKLNSTQVFNGMPPVKIQVTALFRAWSDPAREVESPFSKLMEWALPVKLSGDGSILARAALWEQGKRRAVDVLLPSESPVCIAMEYKGRLYSPLVIESITQPLDSPVDRSGHYVELLVPMTLCTLTALDRQDWAEMATKL